MLLFQAKTFSQAGAFADKARLFLEESKRFTTLLLLLSVQDRALALDKSGPLDDIGGALAGSLAPGFLTLPIDQRLDEQGKVRSIAILNL